MRELKSIEAICGCGDEWRDSVKYMGKEMCHLITAVTQAKHPGALVYFLGGYVLPGTPNWHPVLKKFPLKLIPRSRNGPIFYTPF